jgi:hypothetical protein
MYLNRTLDGLPTPMTDGNMEDARVQSSPNPSSRAGDHSPSTRRTRKREQDRLAQRAARERTKQRIAELELTIARLSSQHGAAEAISALERKLGAVTNERDRLAKSLASIKDIISSHGASSPAATASSPGDTLLTAAPNASSDELDALCRRKEPGLLDFVDPAPPEDPIQPRPLTLCDCVSPPNEEGRAVARPSTWRMANATLSGPQTMSDASLLFEEQTSEDFAVRAVLQGWDSVAAPGCLSPMWTKLRRIDNLQFSSCRNVERLAIMFTMHSLLMFHARPTDHQRAKLPPWYIQRSVPIISGVVATLQKHCIYT